MTPSDFQRTLSTLELGQAEAAQLLGVTPRTVRRWTEAEEVSGPAEAALQAWLRLHERGLAWRPDSVSIERDDQDQISKHRAHAIDVAEAIRRVEKRGGPASNWAVSIPNGRAKSGPFSVSFYKLQSGSFSPNLFRRTDVTPDLSRDSDIVDDAVFCIARAYSKLPSASEAIISVADFVQTNADIYVRAGARMPSPGERAAHIREIRAVAGDVRMCAEGVRLGHEGYENFEHHLRRLQSLGSYPDSVLVSAVARAFFA